MSFHDTWSWWSATSVVIFFLSLLVTKHEANINALAIFAATFFFGINHVSPTFFVTEEPNVLSKWSSVSKAELYFIYQCILRNTWQLSLGAATILLFCTHKQFAYGNPCIDTANISYQAALYGILRVLFWRDAHLESWYIWRSDAGRSTTMKFY